MILLNIRSNSSVFYDMVRRGCYSSLNPQERGYRWMKSMTEIEWFLKLSASVRDFHVYALHHMTINQN